jgi:hypothetical protein
LTTPTFDPITIMLTRPAVSVGIAIGILAANIGTTQAQTLVPQSGGFRAASDSQNTGCSAAAGGGHDAVFLDGALKGDDAKSASSATGSLGISTFQPGYSFVGQINIAAKTDTIREEYGTALLNPGSGKALKAGLFDWRAPLSRLVNCARLPGILEKFFGGDKLRIRAYGSVSRAEWALPRVPTADAQPDTAVKVTPVGYGVGLAYSVRRANVATKDLAIGLTLGYAQRILKGDGAASTFDAQRARILGTTRTAFSGLEMGLELQFGEITGGITYYTFPRAATVPGFSRGQVIGGFSLKANVLDSSGEKGKPGDATQTNPPKKG